MKKRQRIKTKVGLVFVTVAALALAMVPTGAKAQDLDSDLDGFTDVEELNGILLPPGLFLPNGANEIPLCIGNEGPVERALCVDPATPDLFVILRRAPDSNIPGNPLEFVSKPQDPEGGLGIAVHELILNLLPGQEDPGRSITATQKAVRITEDVHPEGIILGYANQGTPNDLDNAIIYTEHIIRHVESVYGEVGKDPPVGLINTYIKQTIAHEIGHMTSLAVDYNSRFGGYHYKSGSEVIMEQAVKYTEKKGIVTFYISTKYAEPSQDGLLLK